MSLATYQSAGPGKVAMHLPDPFPAFLGWVRCTTQMTPPPGPGPLVHVHEDVLAADPLSGLEAEHLAAELQANLESIVDEQDELAARVLASVDGGGDLTVIIDASQVLTLSMWLNRLRLCSRPGSPEDVGHGQDAFADADLAELLGHEPTQPDVAPEPLHVPTLLLGYLATELLMVHAELTGLRG